MRVKPVKCEKGLRQGGASSGWVVIIIMCRVCTIKVIALSKGIWLCAEREREGFKREMNE